ncbi:hypothetical protein P167DRAFT_523040 [Morchella conica CCBAS932]|uniref:GPN-loop GTPase 2 n=1 Tax=Morchella conica CCBAS932 TaxID=1392247 RepID=A0A3N4KT86_9PEZI|nr:hypothetical protein P167DRAFT_523040 [Morchella conica CCBAS932]
MPFAQLVIGPPGSGKSTYCNGMHQFMSAIGRKCSIVNLDPANESTTYPCALDVRKLVTLDEIMDEEGLGPNGGVMYALEELEQNIEWLEEGLSRLGQDYVIFDCPGQVELFTHHGSLRNIFLRLEKMGYRLVVIHLVDAHYITDPSKYISILLLCLRSMLQLDLPHINVLSKIDLLKQYGPLAFNLDFYTEVQDLSHLLPLLEGDARLKKYAKLNQAIVDVVDGFGLVSFETLAVEDKMSMTSLLQSVDRAGGYVFGEAEGAGDNVWTMAMRGGGGVGMSAGDVQERWVDSREAYDEFEEKERREREERERERLMEMEEEGY